MLPTYKIESLYKNATSRICCDSGCRLRIDVKEGLVILKGENLVSQTKICDCIIFQNNKKITMVELKSSSLNVSSILEKLTNGGEKSLEIADKVGITEPPLCFILLAKKYSNYFAYDRLIHEKVEVRTKKYPILLGRCESLYTKFVDQ